MADRAAAPSSQTRIETTAVALACAGFAAAGPLALISPKALWIAGVVIALAHGLRQAEGGWRAAARHARIDFARLRLLWLLAALGLASAAWSVIPEHSLERGLRLVLEFAVGALIIGLAVTTGPERARRYLRAAAAGLAVASLVAIADIELEGWLLHWAHHQTSAFNAYGRGAAFSSIAIVPMTILLWQKGSRLWVIPFLLAVGAFILTAHNETAKFVFAAAVLGGLTATWRWTRPLPVLGFAVALVAIPLLLPRPLNSPLGCTLAEDEFSLLHRLGIWNFVDSAIGERPLLGWGLEAARQIPGGTTYLARPDCDVPMIIDPNRWYVHERLPLHPHDFALNLWLELGSAGAFLALCTLMGWAWQLFALPRQRAMALGALTAGSFLPATMSFGMWQGWWLTSLFVLVALCLLAPPPATARGAAHVRARAKQPVSETLIRAGRTANLVIKPRPVPR